MGRLPIGLLAALAGMVLPAVAPSAQAGGPPLYRLQNEVQLGGGAHWQALVYEPSLDRVYFAHGDEVTVLDGHSGKPIGRVAGLSDTHGVLALAARGRGYVANGGRGTVSVFDLRRLSVIAEIPTDGGPDEMAYDTASGHLFVMNGGAHSLTVLDPATNAAIITMPLGGQPEMAGVDGHGTLFVNIKNTHELVRFDTRTNRIVARFAEPECDSPHGLAVDPDLDRVFMSCTGGLVLAIDPATGKPVARIPIGQQTDMLLRDPVRHRLFSPNETGTLSIIDEQDADHFAVKEMSTAIGARVMALSPRDGRLFLPSAAVDHIEKNGVLGHLDRYRYADGTLRLQIYAPLP